MARQDDWVRFQVRLPRALHARLTAGEQTESLNSEIVRRLERSFVEASRPVRATSTAKVVLDARDTSIPLDSIYRAVSAAAAALPNPVDRLQVEIITKEVALREEAYAEVSREATERFLREKETGIEEPVPLGGVKRLL